MSAEIGVAVIGFGLAGQVFHAPFVSAVPGLRLEAIVQRKGDEAARAYPSARILRSVEEALKDAAVLLMDEPFSAIDAINRVTLQDHLVQTWLAEPRTVVYVTHDIDEAVFLADRIAIMTPSPGRVGADIRVETGRPRDRASPAVAELKRRITGLMHGMDRPE